MSRKTSSIVSAALTTALLMGATAVPAKAQLADELSDLTEAQQQQILNTYVKEESVGGQILAALSSDGKEQEVGGQIIDILFAKDPTQMPAEGETDNGSTSFIPDGYSDTTDDLKKSLASIEKIGIALAVILGLFLVINVVANVITIGQALPSFGL